MNCRKFPIQAALIGLGILCLLPGRGRAEPGPAAANLPNIILAMADDLGWGEVAFNGTNKIVKTPCLDEMARNGIRFSRFYAAAPFCSPTRGSVLTGRHPYRYRMFSHVNLIQEELTIAEVLQAAGYATGHFGKFHMGGLNAKHNPGVHGFQEWFSTPNNSVRINPTDYHRNGKPVGVIQGEDNQILMGEALDFIRKQAEQKKPFLAFIWFHTAHSPIDATAEFRGLYKGLSESAQKKWGDISSMDAQMGRLRRELRQLKVADNTLLCFCTDNGMRTPDLREGKHSLYEGGIRVPGLLEWPARVAKPFVTDVPCGTVDYFPTIIDAAGLTVQGQPRPLDGISLIPLIDGKMQKRPRPMEFWDEQVHQAVIDNRHKLYVDLKAGRTELFDLAEDPKETKDLAAQQPELLQRLKEHLQTWVASVQKSQLRQDYPAEPLKVTIGKAGE